MSAARVPRIQLVVAVASTAVHRVVCFHKLVVVVVVHLMYARVATLWPTVSLWLARVVVVGFILVPRTLVLVALVALVAALLVALVGLWVLVALTRQTAVMAALKRRVVRVAPATEVPMAPMAHSAP